MKLIPLAFLALLAACQHGYTPPAPKPDTVENCRLYGYPIGSPWNDSCVRGERVDWVPISVTMCSKKDLTWGTKEFDACLKEQEKKQAKREAEKKQTAAKAAEERRKAEVAPLEAKCKEYGLKKGTSAFADCMMKLEALRHQADLEAQRSDELARMQQRQIEADVEAQRRDAMTGLGMTLLNNSQPQARQPVTTNCFTNNRGQVNCTTW